MNAPAKVSPLRPAYGLADALAYLFAPGSAFELCGIGPAVKKHRLWGDGFAAGKKAIVAGWFQDQPRAAEVADQLSAEAQPEGVYVTLNPVTPALLGRADHRLKAGANRTQDVDVPHLCNLLIDCDPLRPAGISSTDAEKAAAKARAKAIRDHLLALGWPDPLVADSGNGFHLILKIDLTNTADSVALLKRVLQALAARFDTDAIKVDQGVFNPSRLVKLWGTMARKGDDTADRPHRRSAILRFPASPQPVSLELLEALAAEVQTEPPRASRQTQGNAPADFGPRLDVPAYLDKHGHALKSVKQVGTSTFYVLEKCVFNPDHTDGEAAIGQCADGKLFYQCYHSSCKGHMWAEAREIISGGDPLFDSPRDSARPAPMTFTAYADDAPARGFGFLSLDEILKEPRPPKWLVQDYLEESSLAILFGASGAMKSFLALDMGLCLATGKPWHGQFVGEPGPVFYICGEGHAGIAKRIKAWILENDVDQAGVPFFVSKSAVAFLDNASLQEAIASLDQLAAVHGAPRLVIVDTLARNFGPGDENSTQDMSAFVAALDSVRARYDCAVMAVHHTGLADRERGRGAYALHAGIDYECRLEDKGDVRTLYQTKAKDQENQEPISFEPAILDVGWTDATGKAVTSVVLRRVAARAPVKQKTPLKGANRIAYEALVDLCTVNEAAVPVDVGAWRVECYGRGIATSTDQSAKQKAFTRSVGKLRDLGLIQSSNDTYWPTDQPGQTGQDRTKPDICPGINRTGQDTPPKGCPVCPGAGTESHG